jgi:hypothetical protein
MKPWTDPDKTIEERMAAASAAMNMVEDMHSSGKRDHSELREAAIIAAKQELESYSATPAKEPETTKSLSLEEEMKKNIEVKKNAKKKKAELDTARKKAIESGILVMITSVVSPLIARCL